MKPYIDINKMAQMHVFHDRFDQEVIRLLSGLKLERHNRDQIVKMVRTAYLSGRQQMIEELNESHPDEPERLELTMCPCGHPSCTDVWFKNVGSFTQGSGFTLKDAIRLQTGWDLAAPGGDKSAYVEWQMVDGKLHVKRMEEFEGRGTEDLTE